MVLDSSPDSTFVLPSTAMLFPTFHFKWHSWLKFCCLSVFICALYYLFISRISLTRVLARFIYWLSSMLFSKMHNLFLIILSLWHRYALLHSRPCSIINAGPFSNWTFHSQLLLFRDIVIVDCSYISKFEHSITLSCYYDTITVSYWSVPSRPLTVSWFYWSIWFSACSKSLFSFHSTTE